MASRHRWSLPFAPLMPGIPIDLDNLPAAALGDLPKLADLVLDGLRVCRDPDIERGSLWFGHGSPPSVRDAHHIFVQTQIASKIRVYARDLAVLVWWGFSTGRQSAQP